MCFIPLCSQAVSQVKFRGWRFILKAPLFKGRWSRCMMPSEWVRTALSGHWTGLERVVGFRKNITFAMWIQTTEYSIMLILLVNKSSFNNNSAVQRLIQSPITGTSGHIFQMAARVYPRLQYYWKNYTLKCFQLLLGFLLTKSRSYWKTADNISGF